MFVVMNEGIWDDLSEEDQGAIEELSGEKMAAQTGEIFDEYGQEAVEDAKEKGVKITELSEEELEEWNEFIDPTIDKWIDDLEGKGLPGQEIYDRAVELSGE